MTSNRDLSDPLKVVVAGGGIAGVEALLALRDLAGDRVTLTLISPSLQLILPALSVAEAFALGHAERYALDDLLTRLRVEYVKGSMAAVNEAQRQIRLHDGRDVSFDALVIATGAHPVARVQHATTWWPRGDSEKFNGLLRDLEEGYTKRVAFVIPPGAVWPLPLYELALMTAREVDSMGIDDVDLSVITPEAAPLALFGGSAAAALRDEMAAAGICLETAAVAQLEHGHRTTILLQPTGRRMEVDRVIALPGVEGPRIPGTAQNSGGFVWVERSWRMRGSESIWAVGDAVAYPVKFGGLATQQADAAAAAIARRAGAGIVPPLSKLRLFGVLMTGSDPRAIGPQPPSSHHEARPFWRPHDKVFGTYLTPFLRELRVPSPPADAAGGLVVEETLPGPDEESERSFHALWRAEQRDSEFVRRLGREMHEYEQQHQQAGQILREHGQLGSRG